MPYRRLPNTDNARLKALKSALQKGKDLPPFKLAFSQGSYGRIQTFLPSYINSLSEHKNCYNLQIEKNKDYNRQLKKAKLYLTHFIQVINMAISRGELASETRKYFGLDEDEKKLPSLQTDEEVIEWGNKLIEGEKTRRMGGLASITNPTIAVVKVHFDNFMEVHNFQDSIKRRYQRAQDDLNNKRSLADQLIQQLWNEVEDTFRDLPEELRREKSSDYGVVYVYRKNEMGPLSLFKTARLGIS